MCEYKKNIIVNFIIQKLKSKHTSLKTYTNWARLSHVTQDLEFMLNTYSRKYVKKWELRYVVETTLCSANYVV